MSKKVYDRIKQIELENMMYAFFITASLLNIDANEKSKKKFLNGEDIENGINEEYILSSYLILFVFFAFLKRNYNNLNGLKKGTKEYELAEIRILGSYFLIIGQILVIYYLTASSSPIEGSPI